jgi:hypothetical protein
MLFRLLPINAMVVGGTIPPQRWIATQLGVTKQTISTDLVNCQATGQSKPAKTASNPTRGSARRMDVSVFPRGCPHECRMDMSCLTLRVREAEAWPNGEAEAQTCSSEAR